MDFVVVGFGLGALALLLGVLMHGWLARRWERSAARATTADDRAADLAMAGWRRAGGQALLTAGSALLIATVGALAGGLNDRIGAFLVTTTATVAVLGLLLWGYLYRLRYPAPPRRRSHPSASSQSAASTASVRAALPALRDDALATARMNGSRNGAADHSLDETDVRVVALDAAPEGNNAAPAAVADPAPHLPMVIDDDEDAAGSHGAMASADEARVVALVPLSGNAAPGPRPAVHDEDDPE